MPMSRLSLLSCCKNALYADKRLILDVFLDLMLNILERALPVVGRLERLGIRADERITSHIEDLHFKLGREVRDEVVEPRVVENESSGLTLPKAL